MVDFDYVVWDVETSVRQPNKEFFKADPFYEDNFIVLDAMCHNGVIYDRNYNQTPVGYGLKPSNIYQWMENPDTIIVGHNLKFDLLYILCDDPNSVLEWYCKGGTVWCTMFAEYLLTAQRSKFMPLDVLAPKCGGTPKVDKIKEYWDAGVQTEDIPYHELVEYHDGDLINTEIVFLDQLRRAKELGMTQFIMAQMEGYLASLFLEFNGMYFDRFIARDLEKELTEKVEIYTSGLKTRMTLLGGSTEVDWLPSSPIQIHSILYGGVVSYTKRMPILDSTGEPIRYKGGAKAGEIKFRNERMALNIKEPSFVEHWLEWDKCIVKGRTGVNTNADVLANLKDYLTNHTTIYGRIPYIDLIDALEKHRELSKELKTYVRGYMAKCRPWGNIHPTYNDTATDTGRKSCTNPNLQNVTKQEKK